MVRHTILFFLFFAHVCAGTTQWHPPRRCQPSNGDTASSNMAAAGWWWQCGQQHIAAQHTATQQRHDEQCGGDAGCTAAQHTIAQQQDDEQRSGCSGSNASSGTLPYNTQSPNSDTKSSAVAVAMRAAAHCCTQLPDSDTMGSVAVAMTRAAHHGPTCSHSMATQWAARRQWQCG